MSLTGQTSSEPAARRESLNLRIKAEQRSLIDRGAKLRGQNRTDFILDAARQAAEEAILDQTLIAVSPEAYAEFVALLDAPPQPNARLRKTMQTPAPWEQRGEQAGEKAPAQTQDKA